MHLCYDWSLWLLWFWFIDSQLKTALIIFIYDREKIVKYCFERSLDVGEAIYRYTAGFVYVTFFFKLCCMKVMLCVPWHICEGTCSTKLFCTFVSIWFSCWMPYHCYNWLPLRQWEIVPVRLILVPVMQLYWKLAPNLQLLRLCRATLLKNTSFNIMVVIWWWCLVHRNLLSAHDH